MGARTGWLTVAWLAIAAGPAYAQSAPLVRPLALDAPAEPVELEPMTVVPQARPLDEALERLRERMQDAPCLGCGPEQDAARANPYGWIGVFLTALTGLGAEPPNPDFDERLEHRARNDWRAAEYGPEMDVLR